MLLTQKGLFLSFSAFSAFVRAYQIPLTASDASPLTPDFDKLVADTLDHWHVPGISIAVIDGDKTFSKVCPSTAEAEGQLNSAGLWHRNFP